MGVSSHKHTRATQAFPLHIIVRPRPYSIALLIF